MGGFFDFFLLSPGFQRGRGYGGRGRNMKTTDTNSLREERSDPSLYYKHSFVEDPWKKLENTKESRGNVEERHESIKANEVSQEKEQEQEQKPEEIDIST